MSSRAPQQENGGAARAGRAPRLTVVILNYRTPEASIQAAHSAQRSLRPPDDLVIVDNASSDGSADRLRAALLDALVCEARENLGFSGGMNVGIRAALDRGAELLFLMNSDLTLSPDCLGLLEAALDREPRAGIAAPLLVTMDDPPRIESASITFSSWTGRMRHQAVGRPFEAARREHEVANGVSGAAMLIRSSTFTVAGLFDERFFFSYEDLEFCLRARTAGILTLLVPAAVARHKGGFTIGASSPRRLYFGLRNHLLLCDSPHLRIPAPLLPLRWLSVVAVNLAHAARRSDIPVAQRAAAFWRALRDYRRGRFGSG